MIKLKVFDQKGEGFGEHGQNSEAHYEKQMEKWPWEVAPTVGVMVQMGCNSYPIDYIYLGSDTSSEVHVSMDSETSPSPSWHEKMRDEGYVLTPS